MNPFVVNVRTAKPGTFVYVGRRCGRFTGSPFANPFKVGMPWHKAVELLIGVPGALAFAAGTKVERGVAVACFRAWFMAQPDLISRAKRELKGKTLGCWCAPDQCHAEILAEVANS